MLELRNRSWGRLREGHSLPWCRTVMEGRVRISVGSVWHQSPPSSLSTQPLVVLGSLPTLSDTLPPNPHPHTASQQLQSPQAPSWVLNVTATWGHSCQHHLEWSGTHEHIMWGGGAQGALSPRGLCPGQWLGCWAAHLSLLSCPGRSEPFSTACGIPGAPGSLCPPSGHLLACSAHGPGHKPPLSLGAGGYLWVGGQDPCTCRPRFPEASSPEKEQAGGEGGGALGPGSPAQPSKEHFGHTETGSLPFWVWSAEPAQGRLSTPLRGFQLQRVPIVLCSMGPVSQRFGTDTPLSLTI